MELCQERRGIFKDMKYLDTDRVDIHYELPLNEIIYDFFDALKSRTRGYASFDYEMIGYAKSDLVKLDMMLNGEVVDALSFYYVHKDSKGKHAHRRRRKMARKVAAKNSAPIVSESSDTSLYRRKSVAREAVKAVRRDVLAAAWRVISAVNGNCWKNKEGKKNVCVNWEP
ncbi:MAG: hypothetical protein ACLTE2_03355 [Eubacteriales bacterium]